MDFQVSSKRMHVSRTTSKATSWLYLTIIVVVFSLSLTRGFTCIANHESRMSRSSHIVSHMNAHKNEAETRREIIKSLAFTFTTGWVASAYGNDFVDVPKEISYAIIKPVSNVSAPKPQRGQTIKVSYTLSLNGFEDDPNCVVIDSTRGFLGDRGLEIFAGVGQVIKGGDVLLLDMKEGEQRRAIIPPEYAFGSQGIKGRVPPNSTIYFDVQLKRLKGMPPIDKETLEKWLLEHPIT